jgi:hypothetical protein
MYSFYSEYFIVYKYICKIYMADIYISNEVIEYQDLYRKKDQIRKDLLEKIVNFISISVKCIFCRYLMTLKKINFI